MKVNEMFPRKYATGQDLNGKPITLTIARLAAEKMRPGPGAKEESKWVIYFEKAQKGVILNRTLANQIAEALGSDDTDKWTGLPITLYPEPMSVAGKRQIAIRARRASAAPAAEPQPASPPPTNLPAPAQPVQPPTSPPATQLTLDQAPIAQATAAATTATAAITIGGDATAFISKDRYFQEADQVHHVSREAAERIALILGVVRPQSDHAPAWAFLPYFSRAKKLGLDFPAARQILDDVLYDLEAAMDVLEKQHTPPHK